MAKLLWEPSESGIKSSNMYRFMVGINEQHGQNRSLSPGHIPLDQDCEADDRSTRQHPLTQQPPTDHNGMYQGCHPQNEGQVGGVGADHVAYPEVHLTAEGRDG